MGSHRHSLLPTPAYHLPHSLSEKILQAEDSNINLFKSNRSTSEDKIMMHIRQSEEGKRHRRQSSISSNGDDCFLGSSGLQGQPSRLQGHQLPQVVTVSSISELQSALIERDARISFLEKELVDTRLQLALAKTSEDQLLMELHNMSLEATRNSPICLVSEDNSGSDRCIWRHQRHCAH